MILAVTWETIKFAPFIDFPLVALTLVLFVFNFNSWAHTANIDTTIDLQQRLPQARYRVTVLLLGLLLLCWFANLAVWPVFVIFLIIGAAITAFGGNVPNPGVLLFFAANLIRDWCFGFPELILRPAPRPYLHRDEQVDPLVGHEGVAVSSLRPTGVVNLDGEELSAVSDTGSMIDAESLIVVTGRRGSMIAVRCRDLNSG